MLCCIAFVATFTVCVTSNAEDKQDSQYWKYYTDVRIDSHSDTVWSLYDEIVEAHPDTANEYSRMDWIKEVRSINGLDLNYSIVYGERIVVPYLSTDFVW